MSGPGTKPRRCRDGVETYAERSVCPRTGSSPDVARERRTAARACVSLGDRSIVARRSLDRRSKSLRLPAALFSNCFRSYEPALCLASRRVETFLCLVVSRCAWRAREAAVRTCWENEVVKVSAQCERDGVRDVSVTSA